MPKKVGPPGQAGQEAHNTELGSFSNQIVTPPTDELQAAPAKKVAHDPHRNTAYARWFASQPKCRPAERATALAFPGR